MTIGVVQMSIVAIVGRLWFRVPFDGQLWVVVLGLFLFMLTTVALGLFISLVSHTRQQAQQTVMFIMLPFMVLSGFIFPVASMPPVFQVITYVIPLRYAIEILRGTFIEGAGARELIQLLALAAFSVVLLGSAVFSFHKRLSDRRWTDVTDSAHHASRRSRRRGCPDIAVSVRGLTKRFGDFTAVDGIDFEVARGEIFGFLGPNGSGKTTTIRMLTGAIAPHSGSIRILGEDVIADPERAKRRIGYMSQKFSLFEDLTVDENLRFYAGVYDLAAEEFARQRGYVLKMADLVGRENELTANLSVGWKQRLALGTATIHEPELLFLDEPTSGVDPVARRHFWDLLYDLAGHAA